MLDYLVIMDHKKKLIFREHFFRQLHTRFQTIFVVIMVVHMTIKNEIRLKTKFVQKTPNQA